MFTIVLGIIIFFFGTIIGSFLNVVIFRFSSGRTLRGRSMCMSCARMLDWHELIPLASFFMQNAKCTKCRTKISWQYPTVEALTGLIFVLIVFKFIPLLSYSMADFITTVTYSMMLWSIAIVISVYDTKHMIIPDKLVYYFDALALAALFLFQNGVLSVHMPSLLALSAGVFLALPFAMLWFFSRGHLMGLGDAKLMLGLGWLVGLGAGFSALMIGVWAGTIVSLYLLVRHKDKFSGTSAVPFGPFLALGTFIVYIFSIDLITLIQLF